MAVNAELEDLWELHAALLEERQNIALSVAKLRRSRRQRGTFVPGDGAAAGPRIVAVQHQIEAVEAIIATLTGAGDRSNEKRMRGVPAAPASIRDVSDHAPEF